MIIATLTLTLAALAGWFIGLTGHAFRVTHWRDRGARFAWGAIATLGVSATLPTALAVSVLAGQAVLIAVIPPALAAGAAGAWRASEALCLRKAGGRRGRA